MEGLGTEIVFIPGQDSDKTCVSRPASVKHRVAREGGSCRISLHLLASLLPRDNGAATAACPARARAASRGG